MQHGGQQLGRKLQSEEESSLEKGHVHGFHNDVAGKNVWKPTDGQLAESDSDPGL